MPQCRQLGTHGGGWSNCYELLVDPVQSLDSIGPQYDGNRSNADTTKERERNENESAGLAHDVCEVA